MPDVASLRAVFAADTSDFDKKTGKVRKNLNTMTREFGSGLESVGRNITGIGAKVSLLSAPLAGLGLVAANAAIDWEDAFAGVRKTVDGTDRELADLEQGLRDLATSAESPVSSLANAHQELAGVAEAAGQLGVQTEDILKFTETMGILGMTTDVTADQAAVMTAQFANITGMDMSNVDRFASTLVDLGNNAATTEGEILNLASRIGAAGALAGMSEPGMLALSAAVSSLGVAPEAGGTAISRVLNDITTFVAEADEELSTLAEISGQTATDFKTHWETDASGALQTFLEGLGELDPSEQIQALDDLGWSGARITPILLGLSGNTALLAGLTDRATQAWGDNTAAMDEAQKRANTTAGNIANLKNNANDLAITIGDALLPPLNNLLPALTGLITDLNEAAPAVLPVIAGLIGLSFVAGPVITAIGVLTTGLGSAVKVLTMFGGAVGLVGILVGAYATNLYGFRDAVNEVGDAIREGDVAGAIEGIANALLAIPTGLAIDLGGLLGIDVEAGLASWGPALDAIGETFTALPGFIAAKIMEGFGDFTSWVRTNIITPIGNAFAMLDPETLAALGRPLGQGLLDGIGSIAGGLLDWLRAQILVPLTLAIGALDSTSITTVAALLGQAALDGIANAWHELGVWLSDNLISPITDAIGDVNLDLLKEAFINIGKSIVDAIVEGIKSAPGALADALTDLVPGGEGGIFGQAIGAVFGSMDTGGRGKKGEPYLIGAGAQPELFVPDTAGTFYPKGQYTVDTASASAASGGQLAIGNVVIQGVQDPVTFFDALEAEAARRNVSLVFS
jgi:TP901 family phage tail tape measure protein